MTDAAIITVIATGLEGAAAASPKVMPNMKYPQGTTARTNTMTRPNTMARPAATTAARPSGMGMNTGAGARPVNPYGTPAKPAGSNLGVTPGSMGIRQPRKPESSVPERDIKIPAFLKNTRK